jgi:hypothetical protein
MGWFYGLPRWAEIAKKQTPDDGRETGIGRLLWTPPGVTNAGECRRGGAGREGGTGGNTYTGREDASERETSRRTREEATKA